MVHSIAAALAAIFGAKAGPALAALGLFALMSAWPGLARAWELHNFSGEARVFHEYRGSSRSPYSKTVRPGGMASFHNSDSITVVDAKTGLKVHNPGFKMMEITKEGALRQR
jgi:hypothetical protein